MRACTWVVSSGLLFGCLDQADSKGDGNAFGGVFIDDSDADADADADSDADADGSSECDDYRTAYPSGPYGTAEGDIIDDLPGMVDASGAAMSLVDVFGDRTKQVLVIANAFDT
jgi:hypothetical protein